MLEKIVRQIIDRELQARELLMREAKDKLEDAVCRAIGVPGHGAADRFG